ncbi:MAG: hypothetical protein D6773_14785, partial [Alphaproteobacteria bacterium]
FALNADPSSSQALRIKAASEFGLGDLTAAQQTTQDLLKLAPDFAQGHLLLSEILRMSGRHMACANALKAALRLLGPRPDILLKLGLALHEAGQVEAAAQCHSLLLAIDNDTLEAAVQRNQIAPAALRKGRSQLDAHLTELHGKWLDDYCGGVTPASMSRIKDIIWPQTRPDFSFADAALQQPQGMIVPGLRPVPVFDAAEFPWSGALEQQLTSIRQEVLRVLPEYEDVRPYIQSGSDSNPEWKKLDGSKSWGSIHLYQYGRPVPEALARFPTLASALKEIPFSRIDGGPSEVFLSILRPATRIPLHFGLSNMAVTVHFPILIPDSCGISVGGITHQWKEGELFFFDDSFIHSAWNMSDKIRIVLIFEVWHPDLTEEECGAIDYCYTNRKKWIDSVEYSDIIAE